MRGLGRDHWGDRNRRGRGGFGLHGRPRAVGARELLRAVVRGEGIVEVADVGAGVKI